MANKVKIQDMASEETENNIFVGCRFRGPSSSTDYVMPESYKNIADDILNLAARPDDVWVTGYLRSGPWGPSASKLFTEIAKRLVEVTGDRRAGDFLAQRISIAIQRGNVASILGTTLTQELVWQVATECDVETASKIPLMTRYMFLEGQMSVGFIKSKMKGEVNERVYTFKEINSAPSPRFIKSHAPFSLLPSNLLDTTKVVYIARDPRDVAVSVYQFSKKIFQYLGDFKMLWNIFVNDLYMFSPIMEHVKEAWELRHHPNMMFIFYEDMIKDIPSYIKRVADFLNKELTDDQISKLTEHLNIKNFRKNDSVNPTWLAKGGNPDGEDFVRKGGAGGWRQYFDEEMAAQAQRWMAEHLAGSDLRFPDHTC